MYTGTNPGGAIGPIVPRYGTTSDVAATCASASATLAPRCTGALRNQRPRCSGKRAPILSIAGVTSAKSQTLNSHVSNRLHHGVGAFQYQFLDASCVKKNSPAAVQAAKVSAKRCGRVHGASLILRRSLT